MTASPASRLSITKVQRDPERDAEQRPLDLRLIRRLFGYMRPYARRRNWLLLFVLLRGIQLPLISWSIGAVIGGPIKGDGPMSSVLWGTAGVIAWSLFTQVSFHWRYRFALELGEAVIHDLRNEIFSHLQRMPMNFFNRTKLGRIISRVTSDCEAMRIGVTDVLFVSLVGLGQMVVAAALMAYYDWILFLLLLAMSPIMWGLNQFFRKRLSKAYRDIQESFSRVTATLAESVSGIRVTQGFVRQEVNAGLFHELVSDHARFNMSATRTSGFFMPLLEFNSHFFSFLVLLVGGYRAFNADLPIENLLQFMFLAGVFFSPIQILGNQYNQALTAMAGAERVFRMLDTPPDWNDVADAAALPTITGDVEFDSVTFGYDPQNPVLHDVRFAARHGQTVALVGHTGSGKTSIVNLIARFYLPQTGRVLIDGVDIRGVTAESLHHQLGIVLQNNFLFTGTVRENIRVGRPNATDKDIRDVVRRLDFLDLLEQLPQGLDTEVGERGGRLSLGQRQLICFARALIAEPRIVILDEATSSVDTLTEQRVQVALRRLLAGRTSFVVAHRLSTIRHADLVLVLDHGHIVERGTHDELLSRGGVYANLCRQMWGEKTAPKA